MASPFLSGFAGGVQIAVHAQPRASRSRLVGAHDARLKVQLAAPPVDGEANQALIELLAGLLGVPKRQVTVVSGQTGKRKLVRIEGVGLEQAEQLIAGALK